MEMINEVPPGGRLLEIGCGTGLYTLELAQHCYRVVAVDISAGMLDVLRAKLECLQPAERSRVELVRADIARVQLPARAFDCILAMRCMSHVRMYRLAMLRMHGWLKTGGLLLCGDVHSQHTYAHTTLKAGDAGPALRVRTYIRTVDQYMRAAENAGFIREKYQELSWHSARVKTDGGVGFESEARDPARPVVFIAGFRKVAGVAQPGDARSCSRIGRRRLTPRDVDPGADAD
ncbi:MAG: class I SAM-dependent methyltransferase [Planctomycetes bacterium]|nr:class I SAM-dependent methyltransferase [Planctomycetota bacterium]